MCPGRGSIAGSPCGVALRRAGVEHVRVAAASSSARAEPARRPGPRRPLDRADVGHVGRQLAGPRRQAAVEHRHRFAEHVQQPPQPRRDRAAGVVVRDDGRALGDADPAERGGEALRRRAAGGGRSPGAGRVGQVGVDVEPAPRPGRWPASYAARPDRAGSRYQRTSTTRTSSRWAASHSPVTSDVQPPKRRCRVP